MVEILEGSTLRRLLLERYSKNPKSWNFTIAPAARDSGFFDALVSSPSESWQIKIDSIFKPVPLMLGTKVDIDYSKFKSHGPVSYGFRELDTQALLKLMRAIDENSGSPSSFSGLESILGPLEPTVPQRRGSYAQGPFVFTNEKVTNSLSTGQEQLDDKLSAEMRRLMRNRYSGYG